MDLRIAHLYPDLMSIYGDRGNVLALAQRARWRDIAVEVRAFTAGMAFDADWPDFWFFGGGQDQGQDIVGADLAGPNGDALRSSLANGAAALTICGGYQLLGHEYLPENAPAIPGLGVLDVRTRAGSLRFVGNLVADTPDGTLASEHAGWTEFCDLLVPVLVALGGERRRLRACGNRRCGWLFVDRSANGRRRWCDAKACGNRMKVRRYRARH